MSEKEIQRKGQFLWNEISKTFRANSFIDNCQRVENILWNMSNKEFDKIMEKYDKHGDITTFKVNS